MNTGNVYFHLDCETTTLDASTGYLWQIGAVVTDGTMYHLEEFKHTRFVHPELWDPLTLEFAERTYGARFCLDCRELGSKDWVSITTGLVRRLAYHVKKYEEQNKAVWLICNHPDFDATFLRNACTIAGWQFPFKYDRILDMASLMMGYQAASMPMTPKEIYTLLGDKKDQVSHDGLADARRQWGLLRDLGVRLP